MLESMDKGKAKNKSPIIEKRLKEKRHGLGAFKKTLRKAMRKHKKKVEIVNWHDQRVDVFSQV